jgi:hypothetical protein
MLSSDPVVLFNLSMQHFIVNKYNNFIDISSDGNKRSKMAETMSNGRFSEMSIQKRKIQVVSGEKCAQSSTPDNLLQGAAII